jgi:hypothetical protein
MDNPVKLLCTGCEQDVYLPVRNVTLMLALRGEGLDTYSFVCPACGCHCHKPSRPWQTANLLQLHAPTINLADQLAYDMADDDAIRAEMESWGRG